MTTSSIRLCGASVCLALLAACGSHEKSGSAATAPIAAPASMQIVDINEGTGPMIAPGQIAEMHYTGWLYEDAAPEKKGKKFDSSRDHGQSFSFPLGTGQVIKGWDQGVTGMKVGGQRRLVIPPNLGYGDKGAGDAIPGGATLVFDVELLGVK